jgi:phosphoribosylformimino-5-aminoimidazole carboxamide ribonucleotide (ProFAR) isomerase
VFDTKIQKGLSLADNPLKEVAMPDNKKNIQYFEAATMRKLNDLMNTWQEENQKRFLSTSIQKDGDVFCCIALTNPSEVVIVARDEKMISGPYSEIRRTGTSLCVK